MFKRLKSAILFIKLVGCGFYYNIFVLLFRLHLSHKYNFSNQYLLKTQKELGRNLSSMFEALGPSFIKLGQSLSTRPDLFGDAMTDELTNLRDKLPQFSCAAVSSIVEAEFGKNIEEIFESFDPIAVAAASIAQVHKARTHQGDIVAVKILRPNIEKKFASDIIFFNHLVDAIYSIIPVSKNLRLREIISTLADIVKFELDLRFEGAAADQIRENCKLDEDIYIPKVFWKLTTKKVLTLEWVDGTPISDVEALKLQGLDLHEIARKLAISFFNQAYRDGFFHADLHQGNIFVDSKGNIVLVDFGITGILKEVDRKFIAETLYHFMNRNYDKVAELHFNAGLVPNTKDMHLFALACRSVGEPILGLPMNQISFGKLLQQLFEISKNFNMLPKIQLLLLQKTIITLEGVGYSVYPEVNMWSLAEPWIRKWAERNYGFKAKFKSFKDHVSLLGKDIPKIIEYISYKVEKSEGRRPQITNEQVVLAPQISRRRHILSMLAAFALGLLASITYINN